ncbi:MAG: hypothetical protein E7282_07070 [Lachnospiraceae bacterium]|nr:hypothetical protein [Lachnospiraceae bacterium]
MNLCHFIHAIVPRHVEVVSYLQKMSNTRPKAITLDIEMEDYYRFKSRSRDLARDLRQRS